METCQMVKALLYQRLCLVLLSIGSIAQVIAITTTHWNKVDKSITEHSGLWKSCIDYKAQTKCGTPSETEDWLIGVRVIALVGLSSSALTLLLMFMLLHICPCSASSARRSIHMLFFVLNLLSGLSTVTGVIVYGSGFGGEVGVDRQVSWSFGLSLLAGMFFLACAVLSGLSRKFTPNAMTETKDTKDEDDESEDEQTTAL